MPLSKQYGLVDGVNGDGRTNGWTVGWSAGRTEAKGGYATRKKSPNGHVLYLITALLRLWSK